jgi:hypothetical protein
MSFKATKAQHVSDGDDFEAAVAYFADRLGFTGPAQLRDDDAGLASPRRASADRGAIRACYRNPAYTPR